MVDFTWKWEGGELRKLVQISRFGSAIKDFRPGNKAPDMMFGEDLPLGINLATHKKGSCCKTMRHTMSLPLMNKILVSYCAGFNVFKLIILTMY